MQAKTNNLAQIAEITGLRVSKEKTKVMRTKSKQWDKMKLNGEDVEDVGSFTYPGNIITATGGTEKDVKCRIGKARLAFNPDESQTSHCNIKGLSVSEVMRIENMITQVQFY